MCDPINYPAQASWTSRVRWFKIGKETDCGEHNGKAFMCIGPDNIRMVRGTTMPWPYEIMNGETNNAYKGMVDILELKREEELAKQRMTEDTLNAWMDDLMNERIPFPMPEEFFAKFNNPKYSALVVKKFTESIGKLLIQEAKRVAGLKGSRG